MGSAAAYLTVPVESAPERQTGGAAPTALEFRRLARGELAAQLSPLLYLQPDDAPRDAGDDERWRALDEELTAEKARVLSNSSARPAWLAKQPADVQRRWDDAVGAGGGRRLAVKTLTVAPAPAQPDAGAVLLQTVLRRRSHSGHASPSTLSPPVARALARPSARPAARRFAARARPRVARSARGTAAVASCRSAATDPPPCRRLSACRALPSARLCSTTCRRRRGRRSRSSRRERRAPFGTPPT